MNDKLLPCPFCGGEALLREKYSDHRVLGADPIKHYMRECKHCKSTFANWYRSIKKADAAWNRRVKPTCEEVDEAYDIGYQSCLHDMGSCWKEAEELQHILKKPNGGNGMKKIYLCPHCGSDDVASVELTKDGGMTRSYYHMNTNEALEDDELSRTEFYYCHHCYLVFDEFKEETK